METSAGGPQTDPDPRLAHPPEGLEERARRLGPLPYSSLGTNPEPPGLPAAGEVATWATATIDQMWEHSGRPDPFTVVQVPAGDGSAAAQMLNGGSRPGCAAALRLVLVEADPVLRERHAGRLPVESPALFLGPVIAPDDPDDDPRPASGIGPIVTSLAELPVVRGPCVVIAVGWLSRLEYDLFEWKGERWHEVRLAAPAEPGGGLEVITVEVDPDRAVRMNDLVGSDRRRERARYALRRAAAEWLRSAISAADAGWVVAADTWTSRTAPIGDAPVPVAVDQLAMVRHPEPPQAGGPGLPKAGGPGGLAVVRWRIG